MLESMKFMVENWYMIFTLICALILAVLKIIEFIGYPTEKKIEEIKARLLGYVTNAELELGGKTGRLKLSLVYEEFCRNFPYVKKWISFDKFEDLVDEVLPTMREILGNSELIIEDDIQI